jgi:hypothetical protein
MTNKKRIEYVPPSHQVIFEFAKSVCKARNIDSNETVRGLANFLEIVARIKAKQMTDEANQEIGNKDE